MHPSSQRSRRGYGWARYRDRTDAGTALAELLHVYDRRNVLVLGIPRGGVPVAAAVAERLHADLDVIVARKLGAPSARELAIGAVTADGGRFLNLDVLADLAVGHRYLDEITEAERAEARRRETRFRGARPAPAIHGRTVLIVDDGLATGATMRAAVRSVRLHAPARLIVAVPVGSTEACATLREEADVVVCLSEPDPFYAVGLYYEHFEPVEDDEVERILRAAWASTARPGREEDGPGREN